MDTVQLIGHLEVLKAYRKSRELLGVQCVQENMLPALIAQCHPKEKFSHQACWCLEQAFLLREAQCYLHLESICALFPLPINRSGMRSLSKIGFILSSHYYSKKKHPLQSLLTFKMREQLLEGCFDELLLAHGKSANLSFAARAVYLLGKEFDWVHNQMPDILTGHLQNPDNKGFHTIARKIIIRLNSN